MSWLHCAIMSPTNTMTDKTSERWRAVGRFAQVLEAEIHARRNPCAARVVTLLNLCRICRDLEEELLLTSQPAADDLDIHCALLSTAIASGERLLLDCQDPSSLAPLDLSPDALRAKLESLRITFDQWHTELKPERQEAILREVFGGEA